MLRDRGEVEQKRLRVSLPEPEQAAVEVVAVHLASIQLPHVAGLENQPQGRGWVLLPHALEQVDELLPGDVRHDLEEEVQSRGVGLLWVLCMLRIFLDGRQLGQQGIEPHVCEFRVLHFRWCPVDLR
jgi:hypothetical protein